MDPLPAIVRNTEGGALLTVHVQPNASRTECVGVHGDAMKIRLASRPVDGAANDELIRFIADQCAVPRANVRIDAGAGARRKRLSIKGVTAEILITRLRPRSGKGTEKI